MLVMALSPEGALPRHKREANLVRLLGRGVFDRLGLGRVLENTIPARAGGAIATFRHLNFRFAPAHGVAQAQAGCSEHNSGAVAQTAPQQHEAKCQAGCLHTCCHASPTATRESAGKGQL